MAKNTNAKQEFIGHINHVNEKVLCAIIEKAEGLNWSTSDDYGDEEEIQQTIRLTTGWTQEDWNDFLSNLDFMYDSGFGSQELFGTIWYENGTWSDRGEYDGSEYWHYHECPEIPSDLRRIDKERDLNINKLLK